MSVLIIGQEQDPHVEAVARELRARGGEACIVDLSLFPERMSLAVRYTCCGDRRFGMRIDDREYELADFGAAWWRRPQAPQISPRVQGASNRLFAANECAEALGGLWHALDVFWINDPGRDYVAHRKLTQLRVAQDCGFRLPDTLVTNDPAQARVFIDRRGYRNVIYKAFSALEDAWRETRLLREEELDLLESVRYAPVIFQEYVEAVYDVRVTVVGQKVFPAAIHSQQTSYPVDFRMDMGSAKIEPLELPADVQARLLDFQGRLGLQYGAIDLRRRPDGEYVFLEVNPAGQWLFIEQATGQPIAAALAELLLEHDRERARPSNQRPSRSGSTSAASTARDIGVRPCC